MGEEVVGIPVLSDGHGQHPGLGAGEKMVDEELKDLPMRPHVWPRGYDLLGHISRANHVHGVKLYRCELGALAFDLASAPAHCVGRLALEWPAVASVREISTEWRRYWGFDSINALRDAVGR
jgi:hypothetical protein